jgi:hypothetical protein
VPQVVDLDDPDVIALADAPERPDKVSRLDRPSCPGCEHQPGFWPGRAHSEPVGGVLSFLRLECITYKIE